MKKILLIEDNNSSSENTAELLSLANYTVVNATNGKAGIEMALKEKPDLIICDVMVPVLDGYSVLHVLRKNPEFHYIPFIFVTDKTERNEMRRCMELGADDYIIKPFKGRELLQAIEYRLKKAEAIRKSLLIPAERNNNEVPTDAEKDVIKLLTDNRTANKYRKRQIIYYEGNRPSKLFYIKKGEVKTYKMNEEGKKLIVDVYNEGDFFGYVALLDATSYKETAEAMENAELITVPKEEFDTLINVNKEVAMKFVGLMAHDITKRESHLLGLAYYSLRQKAAEALITLNKKYKTNIISISRGNLANIAGTATESLIRTLAEFKSEKLIDIKNGAIIILNEKKLSMLFN